MAGVLCKGVIASEKFLGGLAKKDPTASQAFIAHLGPQNLLNILEDLEGFSDRRLANYWLALIRRHARIHRVKQLAS